MADPARPGPEAPTPDPELLRVLGMDAPRRRRRWGLGIGALLLLAAGGAWWASRDAGPEGAALYETAPAERGDLSMTVTAVGTVQPQDVVEIGSELSGVVRVVHVDVNDRVTAGQALAELDLTLLEAQLDQAKAQVASSRASLEQARLTEAEALRELGRTEELFAARSVSDQALDQAKSTHAKAHAAADLAEAQLLASYAARRVSATNIDKSTLRAPIDGVVLERNVEPGQAVVSALQAATLFRVARDLEHMEVQVQVDEADVGRVEAGQAARFTVPAHGERSFEATVRSVHVAPTPAQAVVTYEAILDVDNPDLALLPGMTATAEVSTGALTGALLVPGAALRWQPADPELEPPTGGAARVWVLDGDTPRAVEVVPGPSDGRRVSVEGPLEEGALVITGLRADEEKAKRGPW
ncbi:MAG: efflux RND transporter periplasmic adaptor subunit [Alphaproteobacteria bacterium]|nr:efflux RND transporter periplasmic adaptor subunit [Alphaproteobacteria bacterium]MCB9797367.1 efflux RND transporter periplasmic adaptor subunit [Alphaproteobacteria bacterium]